MTTSTMPRPTADYSRETALWLARLSAWSYKSYVPIGGLPEWETEPEWEQRTRKSLLSVGFSTVLFFHKSYIARHPDGWQVLVFRGSDSRESWMTNLRTGKRPWYRGEIHEGFLDYASEQSSARESIESARLPTWIAGHSLGGVIAQIIAAQMVRAGSAGYIKGVFTYGQPRAGDARFAEYCTRHFGDRFFRHVKSADPVPLVPGSMPDSVKGLLAAGSVWFAPLAAFLLWPGGFKHSGKQVWCDREGQWCEPDTAGWWFRAWDRTADTLGNWARLRPALIPAHNQVETYLAHLEAAV